MRLSFSFKPSARGRAQKQEEEEEEEAEWEAEEEEELVSISSPTSFSFSPPSCTLYLLPYIVGRLLVKWAPLAFAVRTQTALEREARSRFVKRHIPLLSISKLTVWDALTRRLLTRRLIRFAFNRKSLDQIKSAALLVGPTFRQMSRWSSRLWAKTRILLPLRITCQWSPEKVDGLSGALVAFHSNAVPFACKCYYLELRCITSVSWEAGEARQKLKWHKSIGWKRFFHDPRGNKALNFSPQIKTVLL